MLVLVYVLRLYVMFSRCLILLVLFVCIVFVVVVWRWDLICVVSLFCGILWVG